MATKSYAEMRAELIDRARQDESFRARLLDDPKATVEEAFGAKVPESMTIEVHEDSATQAHLVLPPMAALNDEELADIAAGDLSGYGKGYHKHGDGPTH